MEALLTVTALCITAYILFSSGLARRGITMPMVFLALGVFAAITGLEFSPSAGTTFHDLAEVTLALLLFSDATLLKRSSLRRISTLAGRMLGFGLPLAIALGAVVNLLLLPSWPFWECFLLAALLAPTDAALGKAVLDNKEIPQTLRETINAESGLNDGLGFPFVIFFAFLAVGGEDGDGPNRLLFFIMAQVGIGLAVGAAVGAIGGYLRQWAERRDSMEEALDGILTLSLVGSAYFLAHALGGNSFVSVFAAGFAFANIGGSNMSRAREFMEGDGQFLAMLSFFFIGALLVPAFVEHASLNSMLVILVSIFVVRPVAIWLSLLGTKSTPSERLFLGWFGPRGLATALFSVFVLLDFGELKEGSSILGIATGAVLASAYLHGLSSRWATQIFKL